MLQLPFAPDLWDRARARILRRCDGFDPSDHGAWRNERVVREEVEDKHGKTADARKCVSATGFFLELLTFEGSM